jgi:capsular polysaccharide biosynthesis protein
MAEQVAMMAEAKVVILMHGSAVSNLVFCNQELKLSKFFHLKDVQIVR